MSTLHARHAHPPALDALLRRQVTVPQVGGDVSSAQLAASSSAAAPGVATSAAAADPSTPAQQTSAQQSTSLVEAPQSSSTLESTSEAVVTTSSATPAQQTTTTTPAVTTTTTTPAAVELTTTTTSESETTTTRERSTESSSSSTISAASAFTTVVVVSGSSVTSTSSATSSLASSTSASSDGGSSISTGGVVGIVAGAIAGIVILAAAAVWLFKKVNRDSDDDDQVSPFDKDEFRRASVMLDDVDDGYSHSLGSYRNAGHGGGAGQGGFHSPQMSEHSLQDLSGLGAMGLGRSGTMMSAGSAGGGMHGGALPGLARGGTLHSPRPPTMIQNHYAHQQAQQAQYGVMPSFQPGQIVAPPPAAYGAGAGGGYPDVYGGAGPSPYAAAAAGGLAPYPPHGAGLDRSLSTASAGPWQGQGANLNRANSAASAYSQYSDGAGHGGAFVPAALRPGGSQHGHVGGNVSPGGANGYPDERGLAMVAEEHEGASSPVHAQFAHVQRAHEGMSQSRSGTPTNANVQQVFSSASRGAAQPQHAREESLGAFNERTRRFDEDDDEGEAVRRERRLSVRNGGLDQFDDDADPYGGMH
ncbi:hypothetical protein JCM10207_005722 [Rhodosporidiobolus poonsookiae]